MATHVWIAFEAALKATTPLERCIDCTTQFSAHKEQEQNRSTHVAQLYAFAHAPLLSGSMGLRCGSASSQKRNHPTTNHPSP
mmetsp:Transcript_63203/g.105165  ORF Transcript_63203/g.105165 Transcript_63203/m.105165 type:complete len:82 (-) Transcript_63203:39-284(-)